MRAEEKGTTKERVEAMQKKFDVSKLILLYFSLYQSVPNNDYCVSQ